MEKHFEILKETIRSHCQGKRVLFIPNRGNWGDALIRSGTLKFLHEARIDFTEIRKLDPTKIHQLEKQHLILYGGGGAWCNVWDHSGIVAELSQSNTVIVLPSTFELQPRFENTLFFSRDRFTSLQNVPKATFCHDMAFYLGIDFHPKKAGKGEGYFFRTDPESTNCIQLPKKNRDISRLGKHLSRVTGFFRIVNRYERIFTDRLHVSIAGCLLGKEVHFYPGSYFKNEAVFKSSMEEQFEFVHFHKDFALPHRDEMSSRRASQ